MDRSSDSTELYKLTEALEETVATGQQLQWDAIEHALQCITREKDRGLHGLTCLYASYYLLEAGRVDEALDSLNESIACMVGSAQEKQVSRCYNLLGIIAHGQDNLVLAMEHYYKALSYADRYHNPTVHSIVVSNMADAYYRVGFYEKAIKCYAECIQEYETYGGAKVADDVNYAKMLASYGYCMVMQGQLEEAIKVTQKLERLAAQLGEQMPELAVYTFYAYLCHELGQEEKSKECLQMAMADLEGTNSMDLDNLLNLIHFIIRSGRCEDLEQVLAQTEPKAAAEHNEGLLVQLLVYRLKYCCANMPAEEYVEYTQTFFNIKDRFEKVENAQIMRTVLLRNHLREIEEEQEKLKKKNQQLIYQMEHDSVSGLHNRRYMNRKLEECFAQALEEQVPLGVVFIDIDHFKELNDSHGHQRGDECIAIVASEIRTCMKDDYMARYGGDEFVAITVGDTAEQLEKKVSRLSRQIRGLGIPNEKSECADVVTITIGVVHAIPQKHNKVWDYLSTADEVLYRQKKERKGEVRFSYQLGEY